MPKLIEHGRHAAGGEGFWLGDLLRRSRGRRRGKFGNHRIHLLARRHRPKTSGNLFG